MVNDRIEALIAHFCKGNKSLFAKQIGVTPSVIGNITGERKGNPSFEVAQKILDAFVTVNSDWLMLGRGSMLRSDQEQPAPQPVVQSTPPEEDSFIYKMYEKEKEENKALIEEIGGLKERIRTLESKLHEYESQPETLKGAIDMSGHAKDASTKKPSSPNADNATSVTAP